MAVAVAARARRGRRRGAPRRTGLLGPRRATHGIEEFRFFTSEDGEEFEILLADVLGAGAQGTVYGGRNLRTKERVAVKVIPTWRLILEDRGREKLLAIEEEFTTLRTLGSHPNIAGMIAGVDLFRRDGSGGPADFPHYKLMVMEAVEGRELAEHVALGGPMKESIARHLFLQVLDGLAHVHARGVTHRDLKPENVLVTGDGISLESRVKLVDFGVAKCVRDGPLKTVVGTPSIMAPEVAKAKIRYVPNAQHIESQELSSAGAAAGAPSGGAGDRHVFRWGASPDAAACSFTTPGGDGGHHAAGSLLHAEVRRFSPKIDVWSAGVVLYTCLTGKLPFKSEIEIIESDYLRSPLSHCSEEAKDLLASMLEKEPERRLSLEECMQHPWVPCSEAGTCTIDWDNLPEEGFD